MRFEFFKIRPSKQLEADHHAGSFGWLTTGVDQDQQTVDDRKVHLDPHPAMFG